MMFDNYESYSSFLKEKTDSIDNEINKLLIEKENIQKRMKDSKKEIINCSIFDTNDICKIIKYIMSEVEEKEISAIKTCLPESLGIFSGNNVIVGYSSATSAKVLGRKTAVDPSKTIILSSTGELPFPQKIQFLDIIIDEIVPIVYLDSFEYIKKFIEELIEYRYTNNSRELSYDEIYEKASAYVQKYKNKIKVLKR